MIATSITGTPEVADVPGWCRELFDKMAVGGIWTIPRSGMVFRKDADCLTWVAVVPPLDEFVIDMSAIRKIEFKETRKMFDKAGITVVKADHVEQCTDYHDAERRFKTAVSKDVGRKCISCREIRTQDQFPSEDATTCNLCTPTSEFVYSPDSMTQSRTNPVHDYRAGKVAQFARSGNTSATHNLSAYDNLGPIRAERPANPDVSIKRTLLNIAGYKSHAGPLAPPLLLDDRPLIDRLHEATFTDPVGLQWIADKYALRMLLRKAHCFTLDTVTSSLVADFSLAIAGDLESARRMAIPPFPVTWIDLDNRARLARIKALGVGLTPTAAGITVNGPPVERVGWLIRPAEVGGYYASYITLFDEGVFYAPLSYWWHTEGPLNLIKTADVVDEATRRLAFGVMNPNVGPSDATLTPTPLELKVMRQSDIDYMEELAGELRHIWGLLIALGAGQLGMEAKYSAQPKPDRVPPTMKNGKPLLPIEHKVLHLHLARKMTPAKIVVRMTTHHKHRWHEVRSHMRTLRNKDGSVRKRIPIPSHERGDEKLGRVEKTYRVER
jgi:hypothetical protein